MTDQTPRYEGEPGLIASEEWQRYVEAVPGLRERMLREVYTKASTDSILQLLARVEAAMLVEEHPPHDIRAVIRRVLFDTPDDDGPARLSARIDHAWELLSQTYHGRTLDEVMQALK